MKATTNDTLKMIGPLVVVALLVAVLLMKRKVKGASGTDGWTVYGTMDCGWTRKQIAHMEENGLTYKFVDCSKKECTGMDGYPVTTHSSGVRLEGYNEIFSTP